MKSTSITGTELRAENFKAIASRLPLPGIKSRSEYSKRCDLFTRRARNVPFTLDADRQVGSNFGGGEGATGSVEQRRGGGWERESRKRKAGGKDARKPMPSEREKGGIR